MEAILGLLGIIFFWWLLNVVMRGLGAGARAAARTVAGKGSFSGNFEASFSGMRQMETRLRSDSVDGEHSFAVQRIEAKGLFPVIGPTTLSFSASVLDVTERGPDGKPRLQPVLSNLDRFQERETICYGDRVEVGKVDRDYGWVDWQPILTVIPETLVPPRSGRRTYRVFVLAFDSLAEPTLRNGFIVDGEPLAGWSHEFSWNYDSDGYLERSEKQDRTEECIIRLAVALAFSDGSMHDTEGVVIKQWMSQRLDILDEDDREPRRQRFNGVMQESYAAARAGRLELGRVVDDLKNVASPAARTAALELCLDVMSADGVAGDNELKVINTLAQRLEVDVDRFESLKDKRLVSLASTIRPDVDFHELLNIDRSWSTEQIRTHLNRLYAQWNSRAESLHDPEQRAQAEKMLEIIARARQSLVQ